MIRRRIPRPFQFPWGAGSIVEEASYRGRYHEPCIQLLEFQDGLQIIRLCSYTLTGRFERNSWLAGPDELTGLRRELEQAPRLRSFLSALLSSA